MLFAGPGHGSLRDCLSPKATTQPAAQLVMRNLVSNWCENGPISPFLSDFSDL